MKFKATKAWVYGVAGLSLAVAAAGTTLAQQQQSQPDQDQEQQQTSEQDRDNQSRQDEQERQRQQQDQQRDQQNRQRDQQNRQRDEQQWQRDQQSRQREQDRQRDQQGRTSWPEPNRQQYGGERQYRQYETYGERDTRVDQRAQEQRGLDQRDPDAGLGVNITDADGQGVRVARVFSNTPADEMGLRPGDLITEVNGQTVRSSSEFVSRIRNMDPGDDVELGVYRDRSEQIVRGELETRQEALQLSDRQRGQLQRFGSQQYQQDWRQGDPNWQTGYQEEPRFQQGGMARGGAEEWRIRELEQRINRLSRDLDNLRYSLQQIRRDGQQQFGRTGERQAGYDEFQRGYQSDRFGAREQGQWDGRQDQRQFDNRSMRQDQGTRFQGEIRQGEFQGRTQGGIRSDQGGSDSPGGVTGGLRTRPDSDQNWEDRQ